MPRTPRSRSEIENKADVIINDVSLTTTGMSASLIGMVLEVVLDIRDAVMEGRVEKDDESWKAGGKND